MNSCSKCIENDFKLQSACRMIEALILYLADRDPNFATSMIEYKSAVNCRETKKVMEDVFKSYKKESE